MPLIALSLLLSLPAVAQLNGQDFRYVGTIQSPKGIGFYYAHEDAFGACSRYSFSFDFDGVLSGDTRRPGFRLGYTKQFNHSVYRLQDGMDVDLFYGPGIVAGAVRDGGDFQGPMVALRGILGVRFVFPERPFVLGFGYSGDLGLHMQRVAGDNTNVLRLYRAGLRRIWLPEIHLSYRF